MKEGLHPNYYQATVTCNCGNTFTVGSTKKEIHVEICSKCHPFYTGQQKAAKARGRILYIVLAQHPLSGGAKRRTISH